MALLNDVWPGNHLNKIVISKKKYLHSNVLQCKLEKIIFLLFAQFYHFLCGVSYWNKGPKEALMYGLNVISFTSSLRLRKHFFFLFSSVIVASGFVF